MRLSGRDFECADVLETHVSGSPLRRDRSIACSCVSQSGSNSSVSSATSQVAKKVGRSSGPRNWCLGRMRSSHSRAAARSQALNVKPSSHARRRYRAWSSSGSPIELCHVRAPSCDVQSHAHVNRAVTSLAFALELHLLECAHQIRQEDFCRTVCRIGCQSRPNGQLWA